MASLPCFLSLNPDVLRCVAAFLTPPDRIALSHACKTLYEETWAEYGLTDLLSRFPFERRIDFRLSHTHHSDPATRVVPDRAVQQHVYAAVSDDGCLAAVLAYDNHLRILDPRNCRIVHTLDLTTPAIRFDTWDVAAGIRRKSARAKPQRSYADAAALDVEVSLAFAATSLCRLILACPSYLHLYTVAEKGPLTRTHAIYAAPILTMLRAVSNDEQEPIADGVAGAAALSPDGTRIAWVMYVGSPCRVYLTLWTVTDDEPATLDAYYPLTALSPPSSNALAWARPVWRGPAIVAVVLKTTLRRQRTERVGDTFRRIPFCRFSFFGVRAPPSHESSAPVALQPTAMRSAWLSVLPESFPASLAMYIRTIAGEARGFTDLAAACEAEENDDAAIGPVALNTVHTCPGEAAYNPLSFGEQTRHSWFVAKQPLYSLVFCRRKGRPNSRVLVAAAAHDNAVAALERPPHRGEFEQAGPTRDGRRFAFHTLPWRSAFTSVSAFAPTGKWIVGAALDNDKCYVCVRNLTDSEYSGA